MNHPQQPAVVFFCHGARQAGWREPFDQIVALFRDQYPDRQVELAFLEFMQPGLIDVIERLVDQGVEAIHVTPLFLAPGGHTRRDLTNLVDQANQRWPALQISVGATLTEAESIRQAIVSWAAGEGAAPVGGP